MTGDPHPPDAALIERFVRERDTEAFRELYRRHTPAVFGLVCRLTGGRDSDAADIMQNVWVRAAGNLARFRGEAQLRTWLSGIAINCYREWRRDAVHDEVSNEALDRLAATAAATDARSADIEQVLHALPPAFRDVLVLHDVEGYTHQQIADTLGIEPGTSKSRLSRARGLFRTWWQHGTPERR